MNARDVALQLLESDDEMHKFARDTYGEVAYDLPRSGQGHHDAAHDHISDRLFDKYHASHPKADFRKIAKKALHGYVDDDRKETRANEAKWKRREAARNRPPRVPRVKKTKEPVPYWKKAGYSTPMSKPRKGIGSH